MRPVVKEKILAEEKKWIGLLEPTENIQGNGKTRLRILNAPYEAVEPIKQMTKVKFTAAWLESLVSSQDNNVAGM